MTDMKVLFSEVFVVVVMGMLSISEGIRLVQAGKQHHYDILGPGLYSVGLGAVLIVVALLYFLSQRKQAATSRTVVSDKGPAEKGEYQKMVLAMIAAMVGYIFLLYWVGYLPASFAFFLMINRIVGFRSWVTNVGLTVLMTGVFYLLFVVWMEMMFPHGVWFDA